MKFRSNIWGYFKVGIVFTIFMMVVMFVFSIAASLIAVPPIILMDVVGGSVSGMISIGFGLFLTLLTFVVLGWAVMFFYKKSVFVYKRR